MFLNRSSTTFQSGRVRHAGTGGHRHLARIVGEPTSRLCLEYVDYAGRRVSDCEWIVIHSVDAQSGMLERMNLESFGDWRLGSDDERIV